MAFLIIKTATKLHHQYPKTPSTITFLRHLKPLPALTPRFLSSIGGSNSSTDDDNEDETKKAQPSTVSFRGPPKFFSQKQPFQVKGKSEVMLVDETKEGMLVRVTLPGVNDKGCEIYKEKNIIYVVAHAIKGLDAESVPRRYALSLEFNPELHEAEKTASTIKNGILRLIIPKVGAKMEEDDDERKIVPFVLDD